MLPLPLAAHSHLFATLLFANPTEEFLHFGFAFELLQGIEMICQVLVIEQSVNLAMARRANLDGWTGFGFFAFGGLSGNQVMQR